MRASKRMRQSEEWTEDMYERLRWRFEDNDLIFCVEKVETWRVLLHIKSKGGLYRVWFNYGKGLGRIQELEGTKVGS